MVTTDVTLPIKWYRSVDCLFSSRDDIEFRLCQPGRDTSDLLSELNSPESLQVAPEVGEGGGGGECEGAGYTGQAVDVDKDGRPDI